MPNIRIDLEATVLDGQALTFRSPASCSQVTGLIVYYPEGDETTSQTFQFADAHGNDVGSVSLFAEDVLVKVVLDTELGKAYVQNADTNAYLEAQLAQKVNLYTDPAQLGLSEDASLEDIIYAMTDSVLQYWCDNLQSLFWNDCPIDSGFVKIETFSNWHARIMVTDSNNETSEAVAWERWAVDIGGGFALSPWRNLAEPYTYSDTDLTAGSSALETGKVYLVYE